MLFKNITILDENMKMKKGNSTGTMELAHMIMAVLEPSSVTSGKATIAKAKNDAKATTILFTTSFLSLILQHIKFFLFLAKKI